MEDAIKKRQKLKDEKNLNNYLTELIKGKRNLSSRERVVFEKLVRLTLEFRDKWSSEKKEILTVGDTQKALDIYMIILSGQKPAGNIDARIDELVRLWLKMINNKNY